MSLSRIKTTVQNVLEGRRRRGPTAAPPVRVQRRRSSVMRRTDAALEEWAVDFSFGGNLLWAPLLKGFQNKIKTKQNGITAHLEVGHSTRL